MHHRATASFARPVTLLTQVTPGADLVLQVNLQHSENLVASVSLEEFRILLKAPVCPVLKEGMHVKLAKYPMHHRATSKGQATCQTCPAGQVASVGSENCSDCEAGKIPDASQGNSERVRTATTVQSAQYPMHHRAPASFVRQESTISLGAMCVSTALMGRLRRKEVTRATLVPSGTLPGLAALSASPVAQVIFLRHRCLPVSLAHLALIRTLRLQLGAKIVHLARTAQPKVRPPSTIASPAWAPSSRKRQELPQQMTVYYPRRTKARNAFLVGSAL
eukprot:TRINITY_DN10980_c0_g2_i8.p1 TRINITY_DN10980_c0_g2~~TRINITY_DN10980_c0_g2_i8.p1  ORF type:complete len:277 (-),score=23.53 TRINITY_DN10980_c0_g2_i8:475-1305(-)